MARVEITVNGCDDSSTVILELDARQFTAIKLLETEINKLNTYSCTPSITVKKSAKQTKD